MHTERRRAATGSRAVTTTVSAKLLQSTAARGDRYTLAPAWPYSGGTREGRTQTTTQSNRQFRWAVQMPYEQGTTHVPSIQLIYHEEGKLLRIQHRKMDINQGKRTTRCTQSSSSRIITGTCKLHHLALLIHSSSSSSHYTRASKGQQVDGEDVADTTRLDSTATLYISSSQRASLVKVTYRAQHQRSYH